MSNPFATFRKNQTYWMAALVLIAILSFIVAPAIEMITKSFRSMDSGEDLMVKWDGGQLTQNEINQSLYQQNRLVNFLSSLAKKVIQAGGEPKVPGFMQFSGQIYGLGIDQNSTPESTWFSRVLMTQAEKLGIHFDDDSADEFLTAFCDKKISDPEFNDLLKSNQLTIFEVRELLKQNMAVMSTQMVMSAGSAPSPGSLWQNFLKLNQTTKIEAYPILVSSVADKVTQKPTEAQIQELYEEGKNRPAHPDLPEAGFLRLAQANLEYVEMNYQSWIDREKESITDEDLKTEYDRLIGLDSPTLKVPVDFKAPTIDLPGSQQAPSAENSATPTEKENTNTENATNSPEQQPTEPQATEPQATEPQATEPQATEPQATEPQATEPQATEPQATEPGPQSSLVRPNAGPVRLVAYAQEPEQPADSSAAVASDASADAGSNTTNSPTSTDSAVSTTETSPSAAEATAGSAAPTVIAEAEAGAGAANTDAEAGIATAEPAGPAMRNMTFEEAKTRLRDSLAQDRASKKSKEVLDKLQGIMSEYSASYRRYESMKNADGTTTKVTLPTRPDLKKYAEEHGLTYGESTMQDRITMATTPLGGSVYFSGQQSELVANVATHPELQMFTPMNSQGMVAGSYLLYNFWKTEYKPANVPPLSEVRSEVEKWWRDIEARKHAEQAANDLLKKMGTGDDPWSAALSSSERSLVIATEDFVWLNRIGNQIRLSNVDKLDRVGEDFMKKVFNTEVGQFGVAPNNPKNVYYLFRVLERKPDLHQLQTRFDNDKELVAPRQLANELTQSDDEAWRTRLIQELNVRVP